MSRQVFVFIVIFLFVLFHKSTFAARSLTITSNKSSLFGYEDIIITASTSGFTNGETIYTKGAFYQDGTTNYFGYTQKGDSWLKNRDSAINQKSIKIGEWDGILVVKSDFADSGYKGEGDYKFKVGFYYTTSGGNLSSVNWSSNILDIGINDPDPTPTLIPTSTSTPTPTTAPTSTPTKTPTPSPTKSPSPTLKPTPIITSTTIELTDEVMPTSILRESAESESRDDQKSSKTTPVEEAKVLGVQTDNLSRILISIGAILLLACGILFFRTYMLNKKDGE